MAAGFADRTHPVGSSPPAGPHSYRLGTPKGAALLGTALFWTTGASLAVLLLSVANSGLQVALFWLIALTGAATITAAAAAGVTRRFVLLAVGFGALALLPVLQGVVRGQSVNLSAVVFAIATVGLILSASHAPPAWFRFNVLVLTTVLGLGSLVIGVFAWSGADIPAFYALGKDTLGVPQLSGIFGHPNTLGTIAGLALVFQVQTIAAIWRRLSAWLIVPAVILGPTATVSLLLWSQSRSGLFGAAVGVAIIAIPALGRKPALWAWLAMAAVVAVSLLPWALSVVDLSGFNGRWVAWQAAWHEFWEAPFVGYGPDLFNEAYWAANPVSSFQPLHAHNQLLEVVGINGLVGLVVGGYLLGLAIAISVQARLWDNRWAMGAIAVVVTVASMEVVLGVGSVAESYLTVVVLATVLGSSLELQRQHPKPAAAAPQAHGAGVPPDTD